MVTARNGRAYVIGTDVSFHRGSAAAEAWNSRRVGAVYFRV